MPIVTVHNISDRANTAGGPVTLTLGGRKLRPGKFLEIDSSALNRKHYLLHGSRLWFGQLPAHLVSSSKAALRARTPVVVTGGPLTLKEAREYLARLSVAQLLELSRMSSPPIDLSATSSQAAIVARLSRALFQPERELDPEAFFWLRRWKAVRGGFVPAE